MKKFKYALIFAVSAILAASCVLMCACGPKEGALVDGKAVVKFDPNLESTGFFEEDVTTVPDQAVEPGKVIVNKPLVVKGSPVNPQNLGFRCWCVDKEGTTPWNFKDPVTKSMTLYAKWEARYEVNYYDGATLLHKANVFPGEKAERRDSDVVWKKILGWYTDAAMTKEYDFGASVNANLNLYVKTQPGLFLSPANIKTNALLGFGDIKYKDPNDESTVNVVGEGEDAYADIHFARCQNTSYMYFNGLGMWLRDQTDETNRFADYMTITYKNLGPSTHILFYYVVDYLQEDGSFIHSGEGGWKTCVLIPIETNMDEDGEWATVSVNLVEETMVNDVSEWGTADVLMVPCWMVAKENPSTGKFEGWYADNDVLIRGIEFTAVPTED